MNCATAVDELHLTLLVPITIVLLLCIVPVHKGNNVRSCVCVHTLCFHFCTICIILHNFITLPCEFIVSILNEQVMMKWVDSVSVDIQ